MLLWFVFAVLTALVLVPVLRPLWLDSEPRPLRDTPPTSGAPEAPSDALATDVALYKAQLAEIDEAAGRGLLNAADAEAARHEVARRLLDREALTPRANTKAPDARTTRHLALAAAIVTPLLSILAYTQMGSPWLPSQPFADRQRVADKSLSVDKAAGVSADELVRRVEVRLAQNPEDGQGWDVIAPVYFQMQRFDDAARAYANALRLQGETTRRLAGLGESLVYASNGIVTEPARQAFQKILAREPDRPEPKFWIALATEQDGKIKEAIAAYRALLANAAPDARWRPVVEDRLKLVDPTYKLAPQRGPTPDDVKAAQSMPKQDQRAMIAGMVDGLAQRLAKDPKDLNGWLMLTQSYAVLDRKADAAKALETARTAFAGDAAALARLAEHAKALGL